MAPRAWAIPKAAAIALGFLLLLVTFGHALKEPLFNVDSHIMPRFFLRIPTWIFALEADPYSLDALLAKRARSAPSGPP